MKLSLTTFAALAVLLACTQNGESAVAPGEIPLFRWRARATQAAGLPLPTNAAPAISLNRESVKARGQEWSDWKAFGPDQAKVAVGPHSYPNDHIKGWPVVFRFGFSGIAMPARVEAELEFNEEPGKAIAMTGNLYGGQLGFLVWREDGRPRAATMREYNRKYWKAFETAPLSPAERPSRFPIADRYIHGDSDQDGLEEGIGTLVKGGFSAIMMGPEPRSRAILLKSGLRKTSWAVYSPPGYCFDYTLKGGQAEIDSFANSLAASYTNAGFAREDMALFCLSDEPGWYYPGQTQTLTNSPAGLARFREYLKAQGLKPADVGAKAWEEVKPLGRSGAKDLASKRLFYWTMRFFPWDSANHFAAVTRALEQAFYTNMPILVNWNFFAGRSYVPGPVANNGAKTDPDAAMGGHDWLEFGRMRGCTMLWTEDWFGDQQAWQWSFYAARMRAGARLGGIRFGGYVIPRTAGAREDGVLQKILTLVGSGGKGLKYFVFGPEYVFPGNCYSENVKVLPRMAEAHRMIGKAEPLLWPGERPLSPVGLLMPRSAQMWDAKDEAIPKTISDATNTDLNRGTVDYMAEVFDLYLALQHDNIPAEIVDEDDLTDKGLAAVKVLYVTEPDIPLEGQEALVRWVKAGGTLVGVCGAGAADRYGEPADVLARGLGYAEKAPARRIIANLRAVEESAVVTGATGSPVRVCGPVSELAAGKGTVEARFADGRPALVRTEPGKGVSLRFAWFPGLSYRRFQEGEADKLPTGWPEACRRLITDPVRQAGVVPPVTADRPLIETPVLLSDAGAAVTLLNWSGEPVDKLGLAVKIPWKIASIESVKQGKLSFRYDESGAVRLALPLDEADILMIRK
jgi:hypothetical protein